MKADDLAKARSDLADRNPHNANLPRRWIYLASAVGDPKFSAGQGIGFRAQRISS